MNLQPGQPYPLGATCDGAGVNFAVFSENATAVELCLFDATGEFARIGLLQRTSDVWHVYVPGLRSGQLYGYRMNGPFAPHDGHRFNPNKLLLDPYAKAVSGPVRWHELQSGFTLGDEQEDLSFDARDSAAVAPKSVVVDTDFAWGDDQPPRVPWERTVVYECHVKGLTARHPEVPEHLRGTYLGLVSPPMIEHLRGLGVTAVELLPIHQAFDGKPLVERGLVDYWAYSTIGYFAPNARYATASLGEQVREFKAMVAALHRAGIEVILDVVFNHTGEGDRFGPTVCFRGIDNAVYYRLNAENRCRYDDVTGCGNTLNMRHPRVLQFVMDSLRYWVEQMHVDGFRFDLAPAMVRGLHGFERDGAFFAAIQQDPTLAQVKLIAEPWDLGPGGYQLGNFPSGWAEWNDRYRDDVRRYWRGDDRQIGRIASRLSGSSDVFAAGDRRSCASINYVTCHDGFTLHDLVSYERKHNKANGEEERDGRDDNASCNWGVEGPTDDEDIAGLRERMKRNFLATLAFSLGVPMLCAGDELGRTQRGNNNAYCQDNDTSWLNWELDNAQRALLEFTRRALTIRRQKPVFGRCTHFRGAQACAAGLKDVTWLRPDGREMDEAAWHHPKRCALGMLAHWHGEGAVPSAGRSHTMLVIINAGSRPRRFQLPSIPEPGDWLWVLGTVPDVPPEHSLCGGIVRVPERALVLLKHEPTE